MTYEYLCLSSRDGVQERGRTRIHLDESLSGIMRICLRNFHLGSKGVTIRSPHNKLYFSEGTRLPVAFAAELVPGRYKTSELPSAIEGAMSTARCVTTHSAMYTSPLLRYHVSVTDGGCLRITASGDYCIHNQTQSQTIRFLRIVDETRVHISPVKGLSAGAAFIMSRIGQEDIRGLILTTSHDYAEVLVSRLYHDKKEEWRLHPVASCSSLATRLGFESRDYPSSCSYPIHAVSPPRSDNTVVMSISGHDHGCYPGDIVDVNGWETGVVQDVLSKHHVTVKWDFSAVPHEDITGNGRWISSRHVEFDATPSLLPGTKLSIQGDKTAEVVKQGTAVLSSFSLGTFLYTRRRVVATHPLPFDVNYVRLWMERKECTTLRRPHGPAVFARVCEDDIHGDIIFSRPLPPVHWMEIEILDDEGHKQDVAWNAVVALTCRDSSSNYDL